MKQKNTPVTKRENTQVTKREDNKCIIKLIITMEIYLTIGSLINHYYFMSKIQVFVPVISRLLQSFVFVFIVSESRI